MRHWFLILLLLPSLACAGNSWNGAYTGNATESWQMAEGAEASSGQLSHEQVRLALSQDEEGEILLTVGDLTLQCEKPGEGLSVTAVPPQQVNRKLDEPTELTVEGELRLLPDEKATLSLTGTPTSPELAGSYGFSFEGTKIDLSESPD